MKFSSIPCRHLTPASLLWEQLVTSMPLLGQSSNLDSSPLHSTFWRRIGPVPSPNKEALVIGIAPKRILYWSSLLYQCVRCEWEWEWERERESYTYYWLQFSLFGARNLSPNPLPSHGKVTLLHGTVYRAPPLNSHIHGDGSHIGGQLSICLMQFAPQYGHCHHGFLLKRVNNARPLLQAYRPLGRYICTTIPKLEYPSCLHTTAASMAPHPVLHTVPHTPL